ncbi:MAG: MurT ligase domain-containing protein [Deltaproteobacteria bacterium]|jgi:UDP-N-acetylmuramyl tripeptide synthase|nr:MurT ligase domain-containing protein [Deltaproteobacteria bacterium]
MLLNKKQKAEIFLYIFLKFILNKILRREGDVLPAHILRKIDKNVLENFAKHITSLGIPVILVTGTNGKTTTSNIIAETIKLSGKKVCFNSNGANMTNGILGAIIGSYRLSKSSGTGIKGIAMLDFKFSADIVVMECDEKVFPAVCSILNPKIITATNFYRDQLDRYGEVNSTVFEIKKAVKKISEEFKNNNSGRISLVLPSFEPLAAFLGYEINADKKYFGFDESFFINSNYSNDINSIGMELSDAVTCPNCKNIMFSSKDRAVNRFLYNFKCEKCGFTGHEPDIKATQNIFGTITLEFKKEKPCFFSFKPALTGDYNAANYLAAYTVLKHIDIGGDAIKTLFENFKTKFGRSYKKKVGDFEINIDLVKNPAGFAGVLKKLTESGSKVNILFAFSDGAADGRDVSWIWDVDFEKYKDYIENVVISGLRPYDMALRLKTAGMNPKKITVEYNLKKAVGITMDKAKAADLNEKKIYILPTYTELLRLKKYINGIK